MVFASGGDVRELALARELVAVGRDFALRDRGAEAPRRGKQHAAVGGLAQTAARSDRRYQRLYEQRHGGIGGIGIVRRHVAQRARGPQRSPARFDRRQEILFAFEADEALELPREARAETIFDERGRAHGHERAGFLEECSARFQQRLEDPGRNGLVHEPELHIERMPACLGAVVAAEYAACVFLEPKGVNLLAVSIGGKTEAFGYRQACLSERGQIGGFRAYEVGVGGLAR